MIDKSFVGRTLDPLTVDVEKGQLRFFAKATGQSDPVYLDEDAARAAGYPSLPAPPTFLFSLDLSQPDPFRLYDEMGVDLNRILHGEQKFRYAAPICAGDAITLNTRIADIYDKKGGAMEFIVLETDATNQRGEDVGGMTRVIVVRNGS